MKPNEEKCLKYFHSDLEPREIPYFYINQSNPFFPQMKKIIISCGKTKG